MIDESLLKKSIETITEDVKRIHKLLESDFFDYLAIHKYKLTRSKLSKNFFNKETKIFFGSSLKSLGISQEQQPHAVLDEAFLSQPLEALPSQCIYFLLNNDIGNALESYKILFNNRPCSLFVIWDWDSQHWVDMSCYLATFCDFYIPVASENTFTISHFNPFIIGPVFVGVNQWPKNFIVDNMELLLCRRVDRPYGPHVPYSAYPRRIRAIATLNKNFPEVKFTDNSYKLMDDIEILKAWSGHKTHWIVPVRSGMPIRVFNCLATGGIPLVPAFYKVLFEATDLPKDVMHYDVIDLIEPYRLLKEANDYFDQQGVSGLIKRIGNFLDTYHIDSRCMLILDLIKKRILSISQ